MCHYSKLSYILHGHVEGRGKNQSSELIDGILIHDKLYVCEQVAVSGLGVYLFLVACIFTVCVCVCCLPYFCIDFCHYRLSNSAIYMPWLSLCAACVFKVDVVSLLDKAHVAVCRMPWKQSSESNLSCPPWCFIPQNDVLYHYVSLCTQWGCIMAMCAHWFSFTCIYCTHATSNTNRFSRPWNAPATTDSMWAGGFKSFSLLLWKHSWPMAEGGEEEWFLGNFLFNGESIREWEAEGGGG